MEFFLFAKNAREDEHPPCSYLLSEGARHGNEDARFDVRGHHGVGSHDGIEWRGIGLDPLAQPIALCIFERDLGGVGVNVNRAHASRPQGERDERENAAPGSHVQEFDTGELSGAGFEGTSHQCGGGVEPGTERAPSSRSSTIWEASRGS